VNNLPPVGGDFKFFFTKKYIQKAPIQVSPTGGDLEGAK